MTIIKRNKDMMSISRKKKHYKSSSGSLLFISLLIIIIKVCCWAQNSLGALNAPKYDSQQDDLLAEMRIKAKQFHNLDILGQKSSRNYQKKLEQFEEIETETLQNNGPSQEEKRRILQPGGGGGGPGGGGTSGGSGGSGASGGGSTTNNEQTTSLETAIGAAWQTATCQFARDPQYEFWNQGLEDTVISACCAPLIATENGDYTFEFTLNANKQIGVYDLDFTTCACLLITDQEGTTGQNYIDHKCADENKFRIDYDFISSFFTMLTDENDSLRMIQLYIVYNRDPGAPDRGELFDQTYESVPYYISMPSQLNLVEERTVDKMLPPNILTEYFCPHQADFVANSWYSPDPCTFTLTGYERSMVFKDCQQQVCSDWDFCNSNLVQSFYSYEQEICGGDHVATLYFEDYDNTIQVPVTCETTTIFRYNFGSLIYDEAPVINQWFDNYGAENEKCIYWPGNPSGVATRFDPCLSYFDATQNVCALCAVGAVRILNNKMKFALCGYTDYDNTQSAEMNLKLANEEFLCYIDSWYHSKFPNLVTDSTQYFPHSNFLNQTSGFQEVICMPKHTQGLQKCEVPNVYVDSNDMLGWTQYQINTYKSTGGCRKCNTDAQYHGVVKTNRVTGLKYVTCLEVDQDWKDQENVPCDIFGSLTTILENFPGEKTVECVECAQRVSSCNSCTSFTTCDLCEPNFLPAQIKGNEQITNTVCLKNYCGPVGYGNSCLFDSSKQLGGILKGQGINVGFQQIPLISQCMPGFYKQAVRTVFAKIPRSSAQNFQYPFAETVLNECLPQVEINVEKDIFIAATDETSFGQQGAYYSERAVYFDPDINDFPRNEGPFQRKMFEQMKDEFAGERMDDPLLFLSQLFFALEEDNSLFRAEDYGNTWTKEKQNVTLNVWLYKGVHHLVECELTHEQMLKFATLQTGGHFLDPWKVESNLMAMSLCAYAPQDAINNGGPINWARRKNPTHDNIKYHFRPLECKLRNSKFLNVGRYGASDAFFDEHCVDLERGDSKPEIRPHGASLFNITNEATFENIRFSGIEALVQPKNTTLKMSAHGIEGQSVDIDLSPYYTSLPLSLCQPPELEPNGTLSNFTAKVGQQVGEAGFLQKDGKIVENLIFNYTCSTGFNASNEEAPREFPEYCNPAHLKSSGVRECPGNPKSAGFWDLVPMDGQFQMYRNRHRTLFNLYAFDSTRSYRTHAPTLNLTNCDFEYFFDKTTLIQVENNNFIEMGQEFIFESGGRVRRNDQSYKTQFLGYVGEDRGARIKISDSHFKHSRFCKGMLYYLYTWPIQFDLMPQFVNFTAQFDREDKQITDNRTESFVLIANSTFDNLAFQQTVTGLSSIGVPDAMTKVCRGIDARFQIECMLNFEDADHRGIVLNLQGFNGTVQVQNSTFVRNMAHIKDIFVNRYSPGITELFTPTTLKNSKYASGDELLMFNWCEAPAYEDQFLFSQFFQPDKIFEDDTMALSYESISPVFIKAPARPVLFLNNTFEDNIGTTGGAIHIHSPNFQENRNTTDLQPINITNPYPFLLIENNTFSRNMAYFAANAVFVASTQSFLEDFVDYRKVCGAGIKMTNNLFHGNVGLKYHTGGAAIFRCINPPSPTVYSQYNMQSGHFLKPRNATENEKIDFPEVKNFYANPLDSVQNVTDYFNPTINYTIREYVTHISHNNFTENYSSKGSSALQVNKISELDISENLFELNGPVTRQIEQKYSPYYKYLVPTNRTSLTFYSDRNVTNSTSLSEYDFYTRHMNESINIFTPMIMGALSVQACLDYECLNPELRLDTSNKTRDAEVEKFKKENLPSKPVNHLQIRGNTFRNNQVFGYLSAASQTDPFGETASLFMLAGVNSEITDNVFEDHNSTSAEQVELTAPKLAEFMPNGYFEHAQGPVVRILVQKANGVFFENVTEAFTFTSNNFTGNRHFQTLTDKNKIYEASLLAFSSQYKFMQISLQKNLVEYNYIVGPRGCLFHFNGGLVKASQNLVQYNGQIFDEVMSFHPQQLNWGNDTEGKGNFPYDVYSSKKMMNFGVFRLQTNYYDMPVGYGHLFEDNTFRHIYCEQGCVYSSVGSQVQSIAYRRNTYEYIVAQKSGAIFYDDDITMQRFMNSPWLQIFQHEVAENIFGSAIEHQGLAKVTIIEDSILKNCFGHEGAAVYMHNTGHFLSKNVTFEGIGNFEASHYLRQQFIDQKSGPKLPVPDQVVTNIDDPIKLIENAMILGKMQNLRDSYQGSIPLDQFIDFSSFEQSVGQRKTLFGQVSMLAMIKTIEMFDQTVLFKEFQSTSKTLGDYIRDNFSREPDQVASIMLNPVFKDCLGQEAASLNISRSILTVLTKDKLVPTFVGNSGTGASRENNSGTVIRLFQSQVEMEQLHMVDNLGGTGVLKVFESQVKVKDSIFKDNYGKQGGVLFVTKSSTLAVNNSLFQDNLAEDGSVAYMLDNQQVEGAIKMQEVLVRGNWALQSMIYASSSKIVINSSIFIDNWAQQVTHGFTTISSKIGLFDSKISFTETLRNSLNVSRIDTGFFNLNFDSHLEISGESLIENMLAQKKAVIGAQTQSSLKTSGNVIFKNNEAIFGTTLGFNRVGLIDLQGTTFDGNPQSSIQLNQGQLIIADSLFQNGKNTFIEVDQANVTIQKTKIVGNKQVSILDQQEILPSDNVTGELDGSIDIVSTIDEKDVTNQGLRCTNLDQLDISDCLFEGLSADWGAAVQIQNFDGKTQSKIEGNQFFMNQAYYGGGAISLNNPGEVFLENNSFVSNKAKIEGGAISYRKNAQQSEGGVYLKGNSFMFNQAEAGGALIYRNQNFTTLYQKDEQLLISIDTEKRLLQEEGNTEKQSQESNNLTVDSNEYVGNLAKYASDVGSYPKTVIISLEQHPLNYTNSDFQKAKPNKDTENSDSEKSDEKEEIKVEDEVAIIVAPGQQMRLKVELVDQEGRFYTVENSATMLVDHAERVKTELPYGTTMLRNKAIANDGIFLCDQLTLKQLPKSEQTVLLSFRNLELYGNEIPELLKPNLVQMFSRRCLEGEYYSADLACLPCDAGSYFYERMDQPGTCKECNQGEVCFGKDLTAPQPGYWRSGIHSENYLACFNPEACLGGKDETELLGVCETGYGGILCADCRLRHFRRAGFVCEKCPSLVSNFFLAFFQIFGIIFIISLLVRAILTQNLARKPLYQTYLKIFLNHYQLLMTIASIDFGWSDEIKTFLNIQDLMAKLPSNILNYDCLFFDLFMEDGDQQKSNLPRLMLLKAAGAFLFPPFVMGLSWLVWKLFAWKSHMLDFERQDKTAATASIVLFLFYPFIVGILAESTNCVEIEGTLHLYNDLEQECYQGTHLIFLFLFTIPGLILWAFGLPLFAFYRLIKLQQELRTAQTHSDPIIYEVALKRYKNQVGFLTTGFKNERFYWEVVLLLRKTFFVCLITFLAPISKSFQSLFAMFSFIGFFFAQFYIQPYYDARLNKLEQLSLLVQIITIYFGLFFLTGKNDEYIQLNPVQLSIFFMVMIPSLTFLFYFIVRMRLEAMKFASEKNAFLFKVFSCGLYDVEAFKTDYPQNDGQDSDQEPIPMSQRKKEIANALKNPLNRLFGPREVEMWNQNSDEQSSDAINSEDLQRNSPGQRQQEQQALQDPNTLGYQSQIVDPKQVKVTVSKKKAGKKKKSAIKKVDPILAFAERRKLDKSADSDDKEIRGLPEGVLSESIQSQENEMVDNFDSQSNSNTNLPPRNLGLIKGLGSGIQNQKRHLESSMQLATVEVSSMQLSSFEDDLIDSQQNEDVLSSARQNPPSKRKNLGKKEQKTSQMIQSNNQSTLVNHNQAKSSSMMSSSLVADPETGDQAESKETSSLAQKKSATSKDGSSKRRKQVKETGQLVPQDSKKPSNPQSQKSTLNQISQNASLMAAERASEQSMDNFLRIRPSGQVNNKATHEMSIDQLSSILMSAADEQLDDDYSDQVEENVPKIYQNYEDQSVRQELALLNSHQDQEKKSNPVLSARNSTSSISRQQQPPCLLGQSTSIREPSSTVVDSGSQRDTKKYQNQNSGKKTPNKGGNIFNKKRQSSAKKKQSIGEAKNSQDK